MNTATRATAAAFLEHDARRLEAPLAHAVLWDRGRGRTSQRRAVASLIAPDVLFGFLLGGNRTGKSEAGAMLDLVYAMGRDNPIVRKWGELNQLDLSHVPRGPGIVWNAPPTFNDSRRFVRPKLSRWAPRGSKWRNYHAESEAELRLPGGGLVVCKAVRQGADAFQGDAVRVIRFDEEPKDPSVVSEALMRIADQSGRLLFTMTPLNGWTDLLKENLQGEPDGTVAVHLHGKDNPHVPPEFLERIYQRNPTQRRAREKGEVVVLEGLVYGDYFDRATNIVDPFPIPDEWPRYRFVDFGTRNPTAVLWAAVSPDDRIYLYREHYRAGWLTRQHARRIYELETCPDCRGSLLRYDLERARGFVADLDQGDLEELAELDALIAECETCPDHYKGRREPEPELTICDPAGKQERAQLATDHDIPTTGAIKDIERGIDCVAERLLPQPDGIPALMLFRGACPMTEREFDAYRYPENRDATNANENPIKSDDHAMDAVRYGCMGVGSASFGVG